MKVQSPLRIDLAGGTLDCWPLYILLGKSITLNFSIDIHTAVILEKIEQGIEIVLKDLKYQKTFKNLNEFLECPDESLALIQRVVSYFQPSFCFSLKTSSQSPLGGGLAASSSLMISTLKAFFKACERERPSDLEFIKLASHLELQLLGYPTGTQDYFPLLKPGFHAIHYHLEGIRSEILDLKAQDFQKQFFLVDTGVPHQSGLNNWHVIKNVIEKNRTTLNALHSLNEVSFEVYETLKKKNFQSLAPLLTKEYESRTQLSSSFSSPRIKELRDLVLKHGGQEVKICGAGGGGCVMVWCPFEQQNKIKEECRKNQFLIIPASPLI